MKITTLLAIILIAIGIMASNPDGYGFKGSTVSEPAAMLISGVGINGLACAIMKRKKNSQI